MSGHRLLSKLFAISLSGALILAPLSACSSTMDQKNIPKPPLSTTDEDGNMSPGAVDWSNVANPDTQELTEAQKIWRDYDMGYFVGASDLLSAYYAFDDPTHYYSDWPTVGLYFPEADEYKQASDALLEYADTLEGLNRTELTEEEIRAIDDMCFDLRYLSEEYKYYLYMPQLNPMGGKQIVYPFLTSLIQFRSKSDVDRYLMILGDYYTFFEKVIAVEKKRSEMGIGWSDENLDRIIEDCRKMQENRDTHFMKTTFESRVGALHLSDQETSDYIRRNQELLVTVYYPAMEMLMQELEGLKGMCNEGPYLAETADGKAYYEALFHMKTGTDVSVEVCTSILQEEIDRIYNEYLPRWTAKGSYFSFGDLDFEEAQDWCERFTRDHFPAIERNELSVYKVPDEFGESIQPARYYSAPIDNYTKHTVWLNRALLDDPNYDMFTLISHEMYPGHLYQHQYQAEHLESKYQVFATSEPYAEGWAEYSEWTMIHYAPIDQEMAENSWVATLLYSSYIAARVSIGVEYEGWTYDDCALYLKKYGQDSKEVIDEYWFRITGSQCYSVEYAFGFLFTSRIIDGTAEKVKDVCTKDEVMKAYLDLGCAPFAILQEDMEEWANEKLG